MLSVRAAVCDDKAEASSSLRVVSGLSRDMRASPVNIPDTASQDPAWETPGIWSVLVESSQAPLLLLLPPPLVSVVVARMEVSDSVDELMASRDLLFVSVKVCVH